MLSVVIIAKNEQDRIKTCLESVKWADEVLIIDNGSTDNTLKVVKNYTEKVFELKSDDFSRIRNFGMERAKGDWVLYIDADERVLNSLRRELQEIAANTTFSAYAISRQNIIFGKKVNYGPYKHDWVIRLLRKDKFETWVGKVHEYPKFDGKLGYTKNKLLHLTHRNVDQFILKSLEWSKIDAGLRWKAKHPKMSYWRFWRILLSEFYFQGIKRGGFFSGTVGIIDSILQVFSFYMTYVRLWQLQQPESLDKAYEEVDRKLIDSDFKYE